MSKCYDGPNGRHPHYGAALSGKPVTIEGVTFRPYRRGIALFSRCSDDFRIEVYRPYRGETYVAVADGTMLPTRFRSEKNAYLAAIKRLRGAQP